MVDLNEVYKAQRGDQESKMYVAKESVKFGKSYINKYNLHNEYEDNLQEVYLAILNSINIYNGHRSLTLPPAFINFLEKYNHHTLLLYFKNNTNQFLVDVIKEVSDNYNICIIHVHTPPKEGKGALYIDGNTISYTEDLEFGETFGKYTQIKFLTYAGNVIKNALKNKLRKKIKIEKIRKIKDLAIIEENNIIVDIKQDIEYMKESLSNVELVIIEKIMKGVIKNEIAEYLNISRSQFITAFDKLKEKIKKIYLKGV